MARSRGTPEEPPSAEDRRKNRGALWSGTLSFGLVSVPVALLPAQSAGRPSLRMLAPDGTPLERRWHCPADDRDVPWEELVRGFERADGSWVVLTDPELEALAPEKSRDIDLRRFVPSGELDPLFFERAYFLAPSGASTKAYRLLARTMEKTGLAGIATFVMRTKEYLVAILAEDGLLRAETLRWAGEVRKPVDVGLDALPAAPAAATRAMTEAIEALSTEALDEGELADGSVARLEALVAKKTRAGGDVIRPPAGTAERPSDEGIIDLMEVLKRSLAGEEGPGPERTRRKAPEGKPGARLPSLSKDELYARARALDIRGRSAMTKGELVEAIRKAG